MQTGPLVQGPNCFWSVQTCSDEEDKTSIERRGIKLQMLYLKIVVNTAEPCKLNNSSPCFKEGHSNPTESFLMYVMKYNCLQCQTDVWLPDITVETSSTETTQDRMSAYIISVTLDYIISVTLDQRFSGGLKSSKGGIELDLVQIVVPLHSYFIHIEREDRAQAVG